MSSDFFQSWNATNEQQMGDFSPLPENKYMAVITDGEWKPTKAGTGEYLQLTFEIINDAQYAGRKVWARLNLRNPKDEAVRIARQELSSICHAIGRHKLNGIPDMCGIPLQITVKCKKRNDNGELSNEITRYDPKARAVAPQAKPVAPTPAPAAAVATVPQPVAQDEAAPWG